MATCMLRSAAALTISSARNLCFECVRRMVSSDATHFRIRPIRLRMTPLSTKYASFAGVFFQVGEVQIAHRHGIEVPVDGLDLKRDSCRSRTFENELALLQNPVSQ